MPLLNYKLVKLQLRVLLAGHTVAMLTYCAVKMMCSPMNWQYFDTMIEVSSNRVAIMTHQNLSAGNCFEPP